MDLMKKVGRASAKSRERNDCAVRAVAIVTNSEYETVHALMTKHGRKKRKRTLNGTTFLVLKELGVYRNNLQPCPAKSVKQIPKHLPEGRYLVWTRGHLLAVVNGEVMDWTEGRRHRPIRMMKIDF